MTKKKKGQDADGDDDREQSRTPIRSELDKLEGDLKKYPSLVPTLILKLYRYYCCYFIFALSHRKRTDSSAGSFESAHSAAPKVQHLSLTDQG